MQRLESMVVAIAADQAKEFERLFFELRQQGEGAAIIAQVYPDGIRAKVATLAQAKAIGEIMGAIGSGDFSVSAFEAHDKALQMVAK